MAERERVHIGQEMAAGHQQVGGNGQLLAGCRGQQGAVITDTEGGLAQRPFAPEMAADQVEFTGGGGHGATQSEGLPSPLPLVPAGGKKKVNGV